MSNKPAISFSASPGPGRSGATVLVVAAVLCQQLGAAVAVLVFPVVGPLGMVALRMGFSAVVLLAVARPRIRNLGPAAWRTAIGLGLVLAAMNSLFFGAIARLPLGTAVTIEVLGPLVLSVVASRRASALLWAVLAFAGVALLGQGGIGTLDATGVGFALGAATCWAAYILLNARAGAAFPGFQGLALAMAIAIAIAIAIGIAIGIGTVASLPGAVLTTGTALADPAVLGIGLGVALLSTAIPYSLELIALRRIPAATFSVLTCTVPAIAALIGFAVLGQPLGWIEAVAIALVVAASIGAIRTGPRARGGDRPGPRSRHRARRPRAQDRPFPQP